MAGSQPVPWIPGRVTGLYLAREAIVSWACTPMRFHEGNSTPRPKRGQALCQARCWVQPMERRRGDDEIECVLRDRVGIEIRYNDFHIVATGELGLRDAREIRAQLHREDPCPA